MSNDEIIRLIGKIRERYDQIHEPSGKLVRLEFDLLRADIRELYEKISSLSPFQIPAASPQSQFSVPEIVEEEGPVMAEPIPEPIPVPEPASEEYPEQQVIEESFPAEPDLKIDFGEAIPSPIAPEPKPTIFPTDPIPQPVIKEEMPREIIPPDLPKTPVQHPAADTIPAVHIHETITPAHSTLDLFGSPTTTLADKFREEKRSINEKLNQETTSDKSIGSKLRLKITDLRSAIGINDRFIFINELFEGDMRMYDDVLGRLNTCASHQEAIEVFNHAKAAQGWSDELSSVERLLDFIHRRYA